MEPPLTFVKNGFTYRLLRKGKAGEGCPRAAIHVALYAQNVPGEGFTHYEVLITRDRGERMVNGCFIPAGPWLPSNEDFGTWGWSYASQDRALQRFNALTGARA